MGKVTDAVDGSPLCGIKAWAGGTGSGSYGYPVYGYSAYPPNYEAYTDQNGLYTLHLPASSETQSYVIRTLDEAKRIYMDATYPDTLNVSTDTVISGVDFALVKGGSLKGRVIYGDTNSPVMYAIVECRRHDPNAGGYYSGYGSYTSPYGGYTLSYDGGSGTSGQTGTGYGYPITYKNYKTVSYSRTDAEGSYHLTRLPPGGYVIYARSQDADYEGYYLGNSDYLDPPVTMESGETLDGLDIFINPKIEKYTYSVPYYQESQDVFSQSQSGYGSYYGSPSTQYGLYGPDGSTSGGYGAYGNYLPPSPLYSPTSSTQDAPSISSQPSLEATVGEPYTYQVSVQDPNRWEGLSCHVIESPSGMAANPDTWLITWTPEADQGGIQKVSLRVEASEGGIAHQYFFIRVFPHMIIESAEGAESPLLKGEWGIVSGTGTFTDTNDSELKSQVLSTQTEEQDPLHFSIRYPKPGVTIFLQNPRNYLSFAIRSDSEFRFCVSVRANDGQDYVLSYGPMDGNCFISGKEIFHPIGTQYKNGQWHLCKRDLKKDLDPLGVTFEYVNYFEIAGNCRLDDLWLSHQPIDYEIVSIKLYQGLNLVSLPIRFQNLNSQVLSQLITSDPYDPPKIRRRNAFMKRWEENFESLREDQGFTVYSPQDKRVTFKGTQKKLASEIVAALLKSGINLVSPPLLLNKHYHGADLLNELRSLNRKVHGIHAYDRMRGAWKSRNRFFNHSAGPSFEIQQDEEYLVHLE